MKKLTNIVLLVLIAISAVTVAMWMFSPNPGGAEGGPEANVAPMLVATACMLGLGVLLLVGMTAMNMGKGRSNSKLGLYVFGGLAVLAVILYFTIAKDVAVLGADGTVFDDVFTLKITDTALYLTYVALGFTVLFLLWGVVRKALK
jgi:hypothetical protein